MSEFQSLFQEIKVQLRKKGLTIEDAFDDIDHGKSGKVDEWRFRRLFSNIELWISDQVFSKLWQTYSHNNLLTCSDFIAEFNQGTTQTISKVSDQQLREFESRVSITGMSIQDLFLPYDRFHSGYVTHDGFMAGAGNSALSNAIWAGYKNIRNEFPYFQFAADVAAALSRAPANGVSNDIELPPYFGNIARSVHDKGIDPYGIFSRYDRFGRGLIVPELFMSACSSLGLAVSPAQLQEIVCIFSRNDLFDYRSFCAALKEEEKKILMARTSKQEQNQKIVESRSFISGEDLLRRIIRQHIERHGQLPLIFENQDKYHTGMLRDNIFIYILRNDGYLDSDSEGLILCNYFRPQNPEYSDQKVVDYRAFSAAITPKEQSAEPQINATIDRLRNYLEKTRRCLKPILRRYDQASEGMILFSQLLASFRMVEFDISQRETTLLKSKVAPNNLVDYEAFCNIVDPIIVQNLPNKSIQDQNQSGNPNQDNFNMNLKQTNYPPRNTARAESFKVPLAPPEEETKKSLIQIYKVMKNAHADLLTELRNYERNPLNLFKPSTLRAVFSEYGIPYSCTLEICRHYARESRVDGSAINSDIQALLSQNSQESTIRNDQVSTNSSINQQNQILDDSLISESNRIYVRQLKAALSATGYDLETLCKPYSNGAFVPRHKFVMILKSLKIPENSIEKIVDLFSDPKVPERINHPRLSLILNQETFSEADKASINMKAPQDAGNNESEEAPIREIAAIMRSKIFARRKRAWMAFRDVTTDTLPLREFRNRLDVFDLIIPEKDLQKLIRAYRINLRGDIDWRRFVFDIDNKTLD